MVHVRTVSAAFLTSTRNLCFGVKIRKISILLHTPVLLITARYVFGVRFTRTFHDEK